MFISLKYFGIDSKLVIFKGENYELSRDGKPKQRVDNFRVKNVITRKNGAPKRAPFLFIFLSLEGYMEDVVAFLVHYHMVFQTLDHAWGHTSDRTLDYT